MGKMEVVKWGIWPITVGPKRIPEMISAMTAEKIIEYISVIVDQLCILFRKLGNLQGCLNGESTNLTNRDIQTMTNNWIINVGMGMAGMNTKGFLPVRNPPSKIVRL